MLQKIHIILLLMMAISTNLTAQRQRAVRICGEYTYHAPGNVSRDEAISTAINRAKNQALADRFGTRIGQTNVTVMRNENDASDVQFQMISESVVKGEWLRDTGTPATKVYYQQDMLTVEASVCGDALELTGIDVDISAKVLKGGTETRFESHEFRHEDQMYLWFRTPVAGYLAVYQVDNSLIANCLLPYRNDPAGMVKVQHGKDYVFFSKKHADRNEAAIVDEYVLLCDRSIEHDVLYIIFSPNEFRKANDLHMGEAALPNQMPFDEFQRWLARNRQRDKDMKVKPVILTIRQ